MRMNDLVINTKENQLLSGAGIPFPIDYPALRSSLDVTLHLEGTMTYKVTDERRFALAELSTLCSDVCSALSIAVSVAAEQIGHPSRIPDHAGELSISIHDSLAKRWAELYGAEPGALVITGVSLLPDDQAMMEKMDKSEEFAGKSKEEQIHSMAEMLRAAQMEAMNGMVMQTKTWTCTCGTNNRGNYCMECGKIRVWTCKCGALNSGNYCPDCGNPRV